MRFLSLFSGIEAASAAWLPMGWECVGFSEIEPFPCEVLRHYYPDVPNLGDVTKITMQQIANLGPIDIIVGGFPCQDLSIAGKRKGLKNVDGSNTRSGLFFDAMRIVQWAKLFCGLRFLLIENVPGLLSSHGGADFASVVREMVGCETRPPHKWKKEGCALGPSGMLEWSVLDARWFGLAQRRKRVFAVADFGDWESRRPILLEPESLRGDSPPRRETRKDVAPTISARTKGGGGLRTDFDLDGGLIAAIQERAVCENANAGPDGIGVRTDGLAYTLEARQNVQSVAFDLRGREGGAQFEGPHDTANIRAASGGSSRNYVAHSAVRRLTPRECERLQGFPDDYTAIPYRNGTAANGPRYKALGNSMAVPCMVWIGSQINRVMNG